MDEYNLNLTTNFSIDSENTESLTTPGFQVTSPENFQIRL